MNLNVFLSMLLVGFSNGKEYTPGEELNNCLKIQTCLNEKFAKTPSYSQSQ